MFFFSCQVFLALSNKTTRKTMKMCQSVEHCGEADVLCSTIGWVCCVAALSCRMELDIFTSGMRCVVDSTGDMVMMGTTGFRCKRWVGLCTAAGTKIEEIEDVGVPRFVVI